jgi:hypothetical protein
VFGAATDTPRGSTGRNLPLASLENVRSNPQRRWPHEQAPCKWRCAGQPQMPDRGHGPATVDDLDERLAATTGWAALCETDEYRLEVGVGESLLRDQERTLHMEIGKR